MADKPVHFPAAARQLVQQVFLADAYCTSRAFYWPNENGEQWSQVLATSARKEFEEARYEMDPVIIARLLVVGRDALMQAQNKFTEMEEKMKEHIAKTKTS